MSIAMLEGAAERLSPFLDDVAFIGGATIALWITDEGAPAPRATKDVDLVVEVSSRLAWERFQERLREHGLQPDGPSGVICRWTLPAPDPLMIDVLPENPSILGFRNRWIAPALARAEQVKLPSSRVIRAVPPAYLVATKLEAWRGRGGGDHLRSHDLEDIVRLFDGREGLVDEIERSSDELRAYVSDEVKRLLEAARFMDLLDGTVGLGEASGTGSGDIGRVEEVVLPRLRRLVTS